MDCNTVNDDTIQRGPRRGVSSWGHGSSEASGGRSSCQDAPTIATDNLLAAFSSAEPSQTTATRAQRLQNAKAWDIFETLFFLVCFF